MAASTRINPCELKNKQSRARSRGAPVTLSASLAAFAVILLVATAALAQQPDHAQPRTDHAAPGMQAEPSEHTTDEEHHSVWAGLLWPTVNFAILAGGLWYFLKAPLAGYLRDRHSAIRKDLVEAAQLKAAAAAQLAEIDRKLQALPGEIEALRRRGAEEIAAEEARISALAAAERERLLEQTRREIDLQVRLAKRELVEHAADLSIQLASERIRQQITPADQQRLTERYIENLSREGRI
jgi:F-type H+-transporting ATPase subunit b